MEQDVKLYPTSTSTMTSDFQEKLAEKQTPEKFIKSNVFP